MKVARILVILVTVVGLMLGSIGSVFAAKPSIVHVSSICGRVVEKGQISNDLGFIELETVKKGLVKVLVIPETKYSITVKEDATFEDIKVGDRVKVVSVGAKDKGGIIASEMTVLPQFVYKPYLLRQIWMHLPPQLIEIWIHLEPPTN